MSANHMNALLAIKPVLGVTLTSWQSSSSQCTPIEQTKNGNEWDAVQCDASGNVAYLNFYMQSLKGSMPTDISKLSALTFLRFCANWFYGTIPTSIITLTRLTYLGLFSNYLVGTVPTPPPSLQYFSVERNLLTGSFPSGVPTTVCNANCFTSPPTACPLSTQRASTNVRPAGAQVISGSDRHHMGGHRGVYGGGILPGFPLLGWRQMLRHWGCHKHVSGLSWAVVGGGWLGWAAVGCGGLRWAAVGCGGLWWAVVGCSRHVSGL
ncbi:unnamed protein product [Closterium sp. NIES-64]|nr:unnamed protein product [Closterium sp. NIES-64]